MTRAIDLWVNPDMARMAKTQFMVRVKEDYFKANDDFFRDYSAEELVELMDEAGIAKSVISMNPEKPSERLLDFPKKFPERFALALAPNLKHGMKALWAIEDIAKDHPVVMARVAPFLLDVPPNDAIYYPLYAKCIELDIACGINTGLPGPPMPGECQDPIHLDRVCFHFPQLKLIMQHGADPWWGVAMRLMIKYKNLYLVTSAYAPKHLPDEFIHFMNTRGQNKVMFASDHPVLPAKRCIDEAKAIDFREGVLDKYLFENAERVLFGERKPRY
ncbi:MAG: amidohydrolase [Polyangiaceae bacterium]|nr:amidohydrolase [Polyangiaceae bacterium]